MYNKVGANVWNILLLGKVSGFIIIDVGIESVFTHCFSISHPSQSGLYK